MTWKSPPGRLRVQVGTAGTTMESTTMENTVITTTTTTAATTPASITVRLTSKGIDATHVMDTAPTHTQHTSATDTTQPTHTLGVWG
mmetsp:Transcript_28509/g.63199  ORF Transcript_28509/g.63199 Transcript_28509/m.63199 type:complete len:87 (-) Transcript_28509:1052-1312(-)